MTQNNAISNQIDPCTLVLFGASGNLARVKLYPGLFRLDSIGRLPAELKILAVGRQEVSLEAWRADNKSMLDAKFKKGYDAAAFERFIARNFYHANPPTDPDAFTKLKNTLSDTSVFPQNLAYFLSVRPVDFAPVVESLAKVGLTQEVKFWPCGCRKTIWYGFSLCKTIAIGPDQKPERKPDLPY